MAPPPSLTTDTFPTTDRFIAAFLLAKGILLKGLGDDGRFVIFLFTNPDLCEATVKLYNTNGAIPIQDYLNAFRKTWQLIQQRENERRN